MAPWSYCRNPLSDYCRTTVGLLSDCRNTVGLSEYCRILSDKPVGLSDRGSDGQRAAYEDAILKEIDGLHKVAAQEHTDATGRAATADECERAAHMLSSVQNKPECQRKETSRELMRGPEGVRVIAL